MIQKIVPHIPFQTRLNLILPFLKQEFETVTETQQECSSTSKVKVKILNVMMDLFQEIQ
jgi:hypothetical protein